ncbi:MAG: hypothetical protein AAGJ40_02695 [Planctomycetota bacterium]
MTQVITPAWYGEPKLKTAAMDRLREHRRLDEIAQGVYFQDGKGCHLGCLSHANDDTHEVVERMFAIPLRIGYWLEAVFEGLPNGRCADWVMQSTEAIAVGADLSKCHHHLASWLLSSESPSSAGNQHELVRDAVDAVKDLHDRAAAGEPIPAKTWSAARSAAWSARSAARSAESAESAAWSAARSAAWSARSAARSAESAAESAAWSAESAAWSAESAARSAARSAAWIAIAERSIEIFRDAPIVEATPETRCDQCVAEAMATLRPPIISVKPTHGGMDSAKPATTSDGLAGTDATTEGVL